MKFFQTKKSHSHRFLLAVCTAALFLMIGAVRLNAQAGPPGNNLQLWLEANVGVTTNSDGGVISWADQSPNEFVAGPPSGANPPLFLSSQGGLNNLPSIQFNYNEWLQLQSPLDITGDITEFAVIDLYAGGAAVSVISPVTLQSNPANSVPEPNQWFIYNTANNGLKAPAGEVWVQRGNGATTGYQAYTSSSPLVTGRYVVLGFTGYHNPAQLNSETVTMYLNNGLFGTQSKTVTTPTGNGEPLNIGGTSGAPLNGEIAELLLYNTALDTNDIGSIWSYFSNKYNIQYSTPAVAISSPTNGATFATGSTMPVSVVASDSLAGLSTVSLYLNGNLISTAIAPPYQFAVNLPNYTTGSGSMTLTAVATDTNGVYADSAPVSLTLAGPSNYTATSNLKLWLEAGQGVSTNSSGGVTGWADQSGNNNNAYLGAAGGTKASPSINATPSVFDTNFIGGQPGIHFFGANDQFLEVPYSPGLDITGAITSVAVVQDNAQLDARFVWFMGGWSGYPSPSGVMTGGYSSYTLIRGNGANEQEYAFASDPYYTQPNVVIDTQSGTNYAQYLDSVLNIGAINVDGAAASSYSLIPSDGEGNSPLFIAARGDAYSMSTSDMEIAEIMIFNTVLSASDLANVESYIGSKYYNYINAAPAANTPPTVAITTPATAITNVGPTLPVVVTAADSDGSVANVQLYVNGSPVAAASAAPYLFTVTFLNSGTMTLTAVATDNLGATTTSAPIIVTVKGVTPTYAAGTNLQLWLRADVGLTTNSGGGVTEWADQSGNNNNAVQGATTLNPPTLVPNGANGGPELHFAGGDREYLQVANSPTLEITGDIASLMVVKEPADSDYRFPWFQGGRCGYPSPNAFMLTPGQNPTPNRGTGCNETQDVYYAQYADLPANTFGVLAFSQAGTIMTQYINGYPNGTAQSTVTPVDGDGDSLLYIGARADFYDISSSTLDIAEIMIFNTALSGSSLASAQNYLLAKYGMVVASAVQGLPAPALSVSHQTNGSVLISWPQAYTGYILQSNSVVSSANWGAVSGVVSNQVAVTPSGGQKFYRLKASP